MIIGWFASPDDRPYSKKLQSLIGTHAIKFTDTAQEYSAAIYAKCAALKLDAIICTNSETLVALLNTQPDFRHPIDARGNKKKLSLDDYAGSCFYIPKEKAKTENDVAVLVLNPIEHLVKVPSAPFVFKRFLSKLLSPNAWFPQTQFTWEAWKPEKAAELLERFLRARILSVDIETYRGDDKRRIQFVGYCALFPDGTTHTIVVPFNTMAAWEFCRAMNACEVPKLFQNGLYDNAYFARFGIPCHAWLHDTQHLFHSWYSELPKRLDFLTAFNVRIIRYWKDDNAGTEFDKMEYNARDCWATLMSYLSMLKSKSDWVMKNYLIEFPLVFPCLHLELDGLRINKERFVASKTIAEQKLTLIEADLAGWFGEAFNPGSPVQVGNLLKVLTNKTWEGTGENILKAVAATHPFNEMVVNKIIAAREQRKLLSTYFVWEKMWNDRLHYKLNPAATDTGRLASTESSFWCGLQIQNISGEGGFKDCVEVDDGWEGLAEADFAQSEARCVAYMSGCLALIELVESENDYHSWNASKFFGIAYDLIWDQQAGKAKNKKIRDLSKRTNHGANYNMGAAVMLQTMGPKMVEEARTLLKLPRAWTLIQVCQHLLDAYAKAYPEIKIDFYDWIKRTVSLTKRMVSALGWTRYFFNDPMSSKPALNAAVAHGPQNLSVGIINEPFYWIWHDTVYGELRDKVRLKAQIHDSIFFAYRGIENAERVRKMMENPKQITDVRGVTRTMLIPPDLSAGKRFWNELK